MKIWGEDMYTLKNTPSGKQLVRLPDEKTGNPDKIIPFAFELTYEEFGKRYRYNDNKAVRAWIPRKRNTKFLLYPMVKEN